MRFGPIPIAEAGGAILAHSVTLPDLRIRKGTRLGPAELAQLAAAGVARVVVARLEPGDVPEDEAAERIGRALAPDPGALGLTASAPFTGRLNLYAAGPGLFQVDAERVAEINALDEAVTLATLEPNVWVAARQMVATVKIIPYAAPGTAVAAAEALLGRSGPVMRVAGLLRATAGLVLTVTPGMKPSVVEKGAEAVRARLRALGVALAEERRADHDEAALAAALDGIAGEMVLILAGSATSDRGDVGPAAVTRLGGRIERLGMPVDPGNLLFLGYLGKRPVIGLPGCARSPKLNGADWVLERVAAGADPSAADIGRMGVGGLLKEIPARPLPRASDAAGETGARRPRVSGLLLAAGAARRMAGRDKLLEDAGGEPMIVRAARALAASGVDETVVVLRPGDEARRAALAGLAVRIVENPRAEEGMGTSIARGMAALDRAADAVLIALGDMPELGAGDHARVIAAFDPAEGREIVRATTAGGTPGHPVLIGRRFFEPLAELAGDRGAREVLREHPDFVIDVALPGERAATDLDTPEQWAAWREARATGAGPV